MRKKELQARVDLLESEREILLASIEKLVDRLGTPEQIADALKTYERKNGRLETR